MNILITGIHGFVGTNLVAALGGQHTLYGLDVIAPEKSGVVQTFGWEALEANDLPEVDVIIHLAGKAHDTKKQSAASEYFEVNTGLTQRIYDYFLSSEARKLIFFSSAKAAADRVQGPVLTEDQMPQPLGPYGESKQQAEQYLLNHPPAANSGKQVYILRPCMIHGPGNKGNLNLLYGLVRKRIPWPLGAFENRRSFCSVANVCYLLKELILQAVPPGIYNLGDDEALSTNELISLMGEVLGQEVRIWQLPRGLMQGLAQVGGWLHLPLNPERLDKLTENYVVSNAKIKQVLGIDQLPVSAREGLKQTLRSFG